MTQTTLAAVTEAAGDLDFDPFRVDVLYSGRGMYGEKTLALVGPRDDLEAAIAHALGLLRDPPGYGAAGDPLAAALRAVRWDQMGKSDWVCY